MSAQDSSYYGWADDPIRAAGGRRHYNAIRRERAEFRRSEIVRYLAAEGISLLARGTQASLARRFGVSEATISRDVEAIYSREHEPGWPRCCPLCGAKPINLEGALTIQEGLDRMRRSWGFPVDDESEAEIQGCGDALGGVEQLK